MIAKVGASRSILIPDAKAFDALPAASTAAPDTDWPAPLEYKVRSFGQVAMPDNESEHVNRTVTGELYHPAALIAPIFEANTRGAV